MPLLSLAKIVKAFGSGNETQAVPSPPQPPEASIKPAHSTNNVGPITILCLVVGGLVIFGIQYVYRNKIGSKLTGPSKSSDKAGDAGYPNAVHDERYRMLASQIEQLQATVAAIEAHGSGEHRGRTLARSMERKRADLLGSTQGSPATAVWGGDYFEAGTTDGGKAEESEVGVNNGLGGCYDDTPWAFMMPES